MAQNESRERQWNLVDDEIQKGQPDTGPNNTDESAESDNSRDNNEGVKLRQLELFRRDELHRLEDDRIGS